MPIYEKPPIIEGVIDVKVANRQSEAAISKVKTALSKSYPESAERFDINWKISPDGKSMNPSVEVSKNGFEIKSTDGAQVVILGHSSITTARLAPYSGWDALYDSACHNWKVWRKHTSKHEPSRLGIRYINRIDIPAKNVNIAQFLLFEPRYPSKEVIQLEDFSVMVVRHTRLENWYAKIVARPEIPSPLIDYHSLVLDIDVFRTKGLPLNDDLLLELMLEGRALKNEIFEELITEDARRLFNE